MTVAGRRALPPAWRFVTAFGVVSLLADVVYEGARAVTGPYLASLGAGATAVGVITGLGEACAFAGRLGSGPLADRTRAYWPLTLVGYGLTVLAVPLLGFTSALWAAAALVLAERVGKAVRSPAKDVLLSHAAGAVGRGRGFAVHEALDQIGAVAGPLAVAAILAASADDYRLSFWALAVPGAVTMVLLVRLRVRVPDPSGYEPAEERRTSGPRGGGRLPAAFWGYLAFTVLTTLGYATFGILSFHLVTRQLVPVSAVPLLYAGAMAVDALAAVATGWLYDRVGRRSLVVVPLLSAAVASLALHSSPTPAVCGVLLWGAVLGIQESTMRAAVADLVPTARRGSAYGLFAAGFGGATLAGSAMLGALYDHSASSAIVVAVGIQAAALVLFPVVGLHRRPTAR